MRRSDFDPQSTGSKNRLIGGFKQNVLLTGVSGLMAASVVLSFGGLGGEAATASGKARTTAEEVYVLPGMTVESIARDEGPAVHESLKQREDAIEAQIPAGQDGKVVPGETIDLPAGSAIHESGYPTFVHPVHFEEFK